jgi:hypothetical protein
VRLLLVIAALGFALPGCEDDGPADRPAHGPLVVYDHGGGYAAQPRHLVIDRDGHAKLTIRSGTGVTRRSFDLPAPQLQDLEDALINAQGDDDPDTPTGCADCFTFSIQADDIDVDLDQVSMEHATNDLQRLVEMLERLSS